MTKTLAVAVTSMFVAALSLQAQQTAPAGRGAAGRGAAGGAAGRGAAEPAPPAPPAGSAATYKSASELADILKKNIATAAGEQTSSPVSNTDQYRVNLVHRSKAAGALAHAGNTELHYIVEGAATVVTGGKIVRPAAGSPGSATIEGGVTKRVTKGDVIIVPENSPHWYKEVEGQVTYLEVRWLAPKK